MNSRLLLIGVALASSAAFGAEDKKTRQLFVKQCASCHSVPDPAIRTDMAWLDQVNRTSWTATPAKARAALIQWLKSTKSWRPARVDAAPADKKATTLVVPSFEAGSLVLARGDRMFAVVWKKGDKERQRALPPGEYTVRTTRVERMKGKQWWFLSSTGKTKLVVAKDKTTKLAIDDSVRFRCNAKVRGGKLHLGFAIAGAGKRGLSVYRDGKRVPVTYRLLDKNGKQVAKGTMNYGWGGGGWASVKLNVARNAVKVQFELDTGPFTRKGELTATIVK